MYYIIMIRLLTLSQGIVDKRTIFISLSPCCFISFISLSSYFIYLRET